MMRFSEQYPESWLVDLSAIESEVVFDNSRNELSSRQKDKLIADGRLSVFREEFSDSDSHEGIPISRDRLVIMTADLKLLSGSSTFQESTFKDQSETVENNNVEVTPKRRDKQIEFICKTAEQLKYHDLLNIPEGGKPAIKTECLKNTRLFTDSGFTHVWKEANKRCLISMYDKGKYL